MSRILKLRGRAALSDFRLSKLRTALDQHAAGAAAIISIDAEYWHLVELERELTGDELKLLNRLLEYGPQSRPVADTGELLLVVPRLGTISPWSSKATDITRQCALPAVKRIERGIAWFAGTRGKLAPEARAALLPLIHDRMTETVLGDFDAADALFKQVAPRHLKGVRLISRGTEALVDANREMGLALSDDEIEYLADNFKRLGRGPTDVELMMFAQANSEHCRHKIFNASWVIDGVPQPHTLFGMIRETERAHPEHTILAYTDNSAIMEGATVERFHAGAGGAYAAHSELTHTLMKVETHNHPTAISPFPGAATGSGGEIRDEGATGRGAKPKAGLTGFSVSNLRIPGYEQPWEAHAGKPSRIASALSIMLEGPIGAASFNNEFGRPHLAGYFRTYEQQAAGVWRGYHKPIMIAGGIGNIAARDAIKRQFGEGTLLIQIGGPGMLIGMGGGAASSMDTGANSEDLDFDSVQRGNAEIQRRAQEVIDRCWALKEANPILSIHDVGAGGLSNALPELAHGAHCGAKLDLRKILSEESGMAPREIWCNEAQERYVLAIAPASLAQFAAICERERCPFAVLGNATSQGELEVADPELGNYPVDLPLEMILGKPPRMRRDVLRANDHAGRHVDGLDISEIELKAAVLSVLRHPAVADKTFLISIGDRTVGGLCSRDQMAGLWQVPVADCAVTLMDFSGYRGEAFAIGERTPLAVIDAPASGRMAVGEALTNLAAAGITDLGSVKLSANWMAAAGHPGEDAALYDTVQAVALELCPALGISIPVGKDSLSMKTSWQDAGGLASHEVVAPLSLIVSAFAPVADVRRAITPQLRTDCGDTALILVDLGCGNNRLGGSILAQVHGAVGTACPDLDDAQMLKSFFGVIGELAGEQKILAYHDRSDGGLLATVCEMAFAGHTGVSVNLDMLSYDPQAADADGYEIKPDQVAGRSHDRILAALFNEELGAVIQVRAADRNAILAKFREANEKLGAHVHVLGGLNHDDEVRFVRNARPVFAAPRVELHRAWSETTYQMQKLRDNPACAQQEYDRILDKDEPGITPHLTYDPADDIAAPFIERGARPCVAILREQGVNGHIEMAAAFDRAGFAAFDVHMSDIIAGRISLRDFAGIVAGGGFSYGDVLGAGEGWAKSILFNPRAHDEFAAFFARGDNFALGVCNGCQMMSNLLDMIPGAAAWPHFVRNRSEQFEARFVTVEVTASPSLFFAGMAGSRIPVAVAHGEGYAEFANAAALDSAIVALRFVDNRGQATEAYPFNPNSSPRGITGLTTADGRYTVLMPHPERVFRTVQQSWHPPEWGEDGPWMRMFRNARVALG
jgi:phosphoribosylformylglycinamidine synthase